MVAARRLVLALLVSAALTACVSGPPSSTVSVYASAPADLDPLSPVVVAQGIAFDRQEIQVRAGRQFILVFRNEDPGIAHNISIDRGIAGQPKVYEGIVFDGRATRWYVVPALAPGAYHFVCDIHPIPMMEGRLIAG